MLDPLRLRARNSLKGPLNERLFFMHIPKCGGTSIRRAIAGHYRTLNRRLDNRVCTIDANAVRRVKSLMMDPAPAGQLCGLMVPEQILLYYMNQPRLRFITGHIPFCELAQGRHDYATVTVLREPVARWISEYSYNRFHASVREPYEMEIDAYLDSKRGIDQGAQYSLFLGGRFLDEDYHSSRAIRRACINLDRCAVAGALERMDDFIRRFHERFGVRLAIKRENVNPRPGTWEQETITDRVRQRIETICEPDLEIYHYARKRWCD